MQSILIMRVFGNNVKMTSDQVAYLRDQVAGHHPPIPYYICVPDDNVQCHHREGKDGKHLRFDPLNHTMHIFYLSQQLTVFFKSYHLCVPYDKPLARDCRRSRNEGGGSVHLHLMNDGLMVHVACLN